jgi:hypothetical protein
VDRVERRTIQIQEEAIREEEERIAVARAEIPVTAFEMSIYDSGIKEHILNILTEAEYETVGDLILAMKVDSDKVLELAGIGPKAMENIEESLAVLTFTEPEPEPEPEPEAEAAVEDVLAAEQGEELEAVAEAPADEAEAVAEEPVAEEQGEVQPEAVAEEVLEEVAEKKVKEKKPRKKDEEEISEDDDLVKDDVSLDELFALKEMFQTGRVDEDEEEDESGDKKKTSKKKKKKHVKMVYDEELGEVVAHKRHKRSRRGDDDFGEEDW